MFKIVYMDMHRMIKLKPWDYSSNITEPGYHAGLFPPHYPVPTTIKISHASLWLRYNQQCADKYHSIRSAIISYQD